jgi:hypothetical protein
MADKTLAELDIFSLVRLQTIVAKMRELGVTEYTDGDKTVKLGNPTPKPADEKSEKEQDRIKDKREQEMLERRHRALTAASSYIGPANRKIK